MKPTKDVYLASDAADELCTSCKHYSVGFDTEPCKSCVVSNFEPVPATSMYAPFVTPKESKEAQ